jgi:hypothetical protein
MNEHFANVIYYICVCIVICFAMHGCVSCYMADYEAINGSMEISNEKERIEVLKQNIIKEQE